MKALSISCVGAIISLAVVPLLWKVSPGMAAGKIDTARIEHLTGAKGQLHDKEGVFKMNVPRTDLNVTVDPKEIADIVGTKGELNNGVYKITL